MKTKPDPPRLYLEITEVMMSTFEKVAALAAEEAIRQYLEGNPVRPIPKVEFLTRKQAASQMNISLERLDILRREGIIETTFLGASPRILSTEITKFYNKRK